MVRLAADRPQGPPRDHYRDLIVVGASAGGVEALRDLVAHLPADLPAAMLVVLHLPAGGSSALAEILGRVCRLPVTPARQGGRLTAGHVFVAPPDHHLLVQGDSCVLSRGPTENGHRPAVNALFRSAALARGPRVVGVVLSGVLDDGAAGLLAIKSRGGVVVVQDPGDAAYAGMPESALQLVNPDHLLTAAAIGRRLRDIVGEDVVAGAVPDPAPLLHYEDALARNEAPVDLDRIGRFAGLTCPDCQGALLALEPGQDRFRCRVGHAWTAEALLVAADIRMQSALWTALRTLDEKAALAQRMASSARARGSDHMATTYDRTAEETGDAAAVLRERLMTADVSNTEDAG